MTTANTTIAIGVNESKLYLFFCQIGKNIYIFLVCHSILVYHEMKKLKIAVLQHCSWECQPNLGSVQQDLFSLIGWNSSISWHYATF